MMDLLLTVVLFTLGIVLIVKGGDAFVDAAAWMAEVSGIPKLIVGATVVSFATTLPELLVSSMAAFDGKVDMAIGNAVGSVTANLALIMGIALVCLPSAIRRRDYLLKAVLMLGASLYLVLASSGGSLSFQSGIALLVIFVIAMWDNIRSALRSMREEQTAAGRGGHPRPMGHEVRRNLLKFLLGAAGIVIGAQLLVDHGGTLARLIGVPERIIGVTLIAVGTSLPELVTTLTAIAKKQASLSAGNIIGANIIDLTLILPICSLISGGALPVSAQALAIDLPACLLVGCIAMVPSLITGRFQRWQGGVLLLSYVVYLVITCSGAAVS